MLKIAELTPVKKLEQVEEAVRGSVCPESLASHYPDEC